MKRSDYVTREHYDDMVKVKDNTIEYYSKQVEYFVGLLSDYAKLKNENGYIKALLDKEADTEIIKYNGKLYRIARKHHFMSDDNVDELDIEAVCVGEVK